MKNVLFILVLILSFNFTYPQDLIIHKNDGSSTSYPIASIDSITFSIIAEETIFFDNFESGSISDYTVPSGHTPPVLSDLASVSPTHSVTLVKPRNSYSNMGRALTTPITSNIIGYSCKMMKNDLADRSHFGIYLFSETIGSSKQSAMGFIKDSIYMAVQNNANPSENIFTTLDVIESNRWYSFLIEYNFSTHLCSFFIDGVKKFESTFSVSSIDFFYLGDWSGSTGTEIDKVLFIDDLKVYKR